MVIELQHLRVIDTRVPTEVTATWSAESFTNGNLQGTITFSESRTAVTVSGDFDPIESTANLHTAKPESGWTISSYWIWHYLYSFSRSSSE